jgi:hypothetical protein
MFCLFVALLLVSTHSFAQKKTWKKTTIAGVEIVPPAGKKPGKIGAHSITKLLYLSDERDQASPSFVVSAGAVGLTGNSTDEETECVVFSPVTGAVVRAWLPTSCIELGVGDDFIIYDAADRTIVCEYLDDPGPNSENLEGQYILILIGTDSKVETQAIQTDGLTKLVPYCDVFRGGDQSNNKHIRQHGPFLVQYERTWKSYLICLGTGTIKTFEPNYSQISIEGCNLIGTRCIEGTGENEVLGVEVCGRDDLGSADNPHRHEYYLIDPSDGSSRLLR